MSKVIANLAAFGNTGENAAKLTFREFSKDEAGNTQHKDVQATYRLSNTEGTVSGTGLKGTTSNGNPIRKLSIAYKPAGAEKAVYYNGALFETKEKKTDKSPDYFGTAKVKGDDAEYQLAGWIKQDKNGNPFISITLSEPYVAAGDAAAAPATAGAGAPADDIPFAHHGMAGADVCWRNM